MPQTQKSVLFFNFTFSKWIQTNVQVTQQKFGKVKIAKYEIWMSHDLQIKGSIAIAIISVNKLALYFLQRLSSNTRTRFWRKRHGWHIKENCWYYTSERFVSKRMRCLLRPKIVFFVKAQRHVNRSWKIWCEIWKKRWFIIQRAFEISSFPFDNFFRAFYDEFLCYSEFVRKRSCSWLKKGWKLGKWKLLRSSWTVKWINSTRWLINIRLMPCSSTVKGRNLCGSWTRWDLYLSCEIAI